MRRISPRSALLLLFSCLASVSASPLESVEVSLTQQETGRGIVETSFWCQIYRGNCVTKCVGYPCDSTCVIASWLYTCQYPCSEVTNQCTGGDSQGEGSSTTSSSGGGSQTTTTATTTTTTMTTTTYCGLSDGEICTGPGECCSQECGITSGQFRCGSCLPVGESCTAPQDCCSSNCNAGQCAA